MTFGEMTKRIAVSADPNLASHQLVRFRIHFAERTRSHIGTVWEASSGGFRSREPSTPLKAERGMFYLRTPGGALPARWRPAAWQGGFSRAVPAKRHNSAGPACRSARQEVGRRSTPAPGSAYRV
jgi:hypothetical protein